MPTGQGRVSSACACVLVLCLGHGAAAQAPKPGTSSALLAPGVHESAVGTPELPAPRRPRFVVDAFSEAAVLSLSLGIGLSSELILSTGEILPQQPLPQTRLLSIDRSTVKATPIPAWGTASSIGLGLAAAYAAIDPVLSGYRDGVNAGVIDALIYGETVSITWAITNLTKIAFRRPRPSAYQEQARLNPEGGTGVPVELSDTNSAMSFFSGHASITSSLSAAATYLAFSRSDEPLRPWLTLGIGAAVTSLVSYGRVKSGEHFPTDVIAGSLVGTAIGVLVPHLHRAEPIARLPVLIGFGVEPGGGSISVYGVL